MFKDFRIPLGSVLLLSILLNQRMNEYLCLQLSNNYLTRDGHEEKILINEVIILLILFIIFSVDV